MNQIAAIIECPSRTDAEALAQAVTAGLVAEGWPAALGPERRAS